MIALMWETSELQRRFERLANTDEEVGGYLFYTYASRPNLHRGIIKSAFGLPRHACVGYLTGWLVMPNVQPTHKRKTTFRPGVNYDYANEMAAATAASREDSNFIHFHTHPNWRLVPSQTDIEMMFNCLTIANGKKKRVSEAAIVSPGGEVVYWQAEYDMRVKPHPCRLIGGHYLAWGEYRMRNAIMRMYELGKIRT